MSASAHKSVDNGEPVHDGTCPRSVLLVDEQAHVLRVMRLNMERCGYQVDAAWHADYALQQIRSRHYDALIVTSDLPDMSARELCERAHQTLLDDQTGRLPLLLVGCDQGEDSRCDQDTDWLDECQAEQLPIPLSLKWILRRLGDVFADSEVDAQRDLERTDAS
jgi:CheY-like chemotaxis protein